MSEHPPRHPNVQELRHFHLFDAISDERLELLAKSLTLSHGHRRKQLLARGDRSDFSLLLFDGDLLLVDAQGQKTHLRTDQHVALVPIAEEIPRLYTVICLSNVLYLEVDNNMLRSLAQIQADKPQNQTSELVAGDPLKQGRELIHLIRGDLQNGQMMLPSLPEVALRIGRSMDDESTDAKHIAGIVQNDPAMTAKLIWVANTVCYSSRQNVVTCTQAVMRLGFKTTYQLVLSFALKDIFGNLGGILQERARGLWRHSVRIAAVCFVLARYTRVFEPEEALLCGLLHEIGVIPILHYAGRFPLLARDPKALCLVERSMRGDIGAQVLREWHFPESIVRCALEAENWSRESSGGPDYCDLLIVAQWYAAMDTPEADHMPALDEMPAYHRLGIGAIDAIGVPEVLRDAGEELAQVEDMLGR